MPKLKVGKRSGLRYFDIADIRSWKPCYDPHRYLPEDFRGTAVDILRNDSAPLEHRLWVVCRSELLSAGAMHQFAGWCARRSQQLSVGKRSLGAAWADAGDPWSAARGASMALDGATASAAWAAAASGASTALANAAANDTWAAAEAAQRDKLLEIVIADGMERMAESRGSK